MNRTDSAPDLVHPSLSAVQVVSSAAPPLIGTPPAALLFIFAIYFSAAPHW
jgi:hypothetical protein